MRERLPERRRCITQRLKINGQTVHFSVGLYPDGRPGELFIDVSRAGTMVRAWCESTAKLISLMLQYKVPLSELVEALAGHCSEPFGSVPVIGHEIIREASGVLDAIVRSMALDFLAAEVVPAMELGEPLVEAIQELEPLSAAEIRVAVEELGAEEALNDFLEKMQ